MFLPDLLKISMRIRIKSSTLCIAARVYTLMCYKSLRKSIKLLETAEFFLSSEIGTHGGESSVCRTLYFEKNVIFGIGANTLFGWCL